MTSGADVGFTEQRALHGGYCSPYKYASILLTSIKAEPGKRNLQKA
jgi:hypothetical protein